MRARDRFVEGSVGGRFATLSVGMGGIRKRVHRHLFTLALLATAAGAAAVSPAYASGPASAPVVSQYVEVVPTSSGGVADQAHDEGTGPPTPSSMPLSKLTSEPRFGAPSQKLSGAPTAERRLRDELNGRASYSAAVGSISRVASEGGSAGWLLLSLALTSVAIVVGALRRRA